MSRPAWIILKTSGWEFWYSFHDFFKLEKVGIVEQRVGTFSPDKTCWNEWEICNKVILYFYKSCKF